MKVSIIIDSEEDPLSSAFPGATEKFEGVLEEELTLLFQHELAPWRQRLEKHAEIHVSLSFLSRAEMLEINRNYRDEDESTDVLSFSLWDEGGGGFAPPELPFDVFPLGDIVICMEETEREHAPMAGPEALCLVFAHGFLHLLGWDHDTPEKEKLMWERQELLKSKMLKAVSVAAFGAAAFSAAEADF